MKKNYQYTIAISTAILLVGCGGGGGGGSGSTSTNGTVTTSPTTVVTPNTPASTTTTTPINTNNSTFQTTEDKIVALINQKRTQCGMSALNQNSELSKAASNHANYLNYVSNQIKSDYASHIESVSTMNGVNVPSADPLNNPYYSGNDIANRVQTQANIGKQAQPVNYNYSSVGENLSVFSFPSTGGQPTADSMSSDGLNGLFTAPYHMRGLMSPIPTDIGVKNIQASWMLSNATNYTQYLNTLEIVTGLPLSPAIPVNTKFVTYPCNGITDTEYQLTNEYPNPIAGRDLSTNPVGQPVYIIAPNGKDITAVDAHISSNGVEIANPIVITGATDPNKELSDNEAFIIPNTPLNPASTYNVNYTVQYSDGTNTKDSFSFTTRSKVS